MVGFGKQVEFLLFLFLLFLLLLFRFPRRGSVAAIAMVVIGRRTATVMRRVDFVVGIGLESAAAPLFGEVEASHDELVMVRWWRRCYGVVWCAVRCPWM